MRVGTAGGEERTQWHHDGDVGCALLQESARCNAAKMCLGVRALKKKEPSPSPRLIQETFGIPAPHISVSRSGDCQNIKPALDCHHGQGCSDLGGRSWHRVNTITRLPESCFLRQPQVSEARCQGSHRRDRRFGHRRDGGSAHLPLHQPRGRSNSRIMPSQTGTAERAISGDR